MSKPADIGTKRLISLSPDNWVKWVTNSADIYVKDFLSSDFQWISKENDVLLKVSNANKKEFLVLNELQLRYQRQMPLRMRAYVALAEERYHLPVYPVLINILPNSKAEKITNCYQSNFMGIKAYQDYRVINLWEVEAQLVFSENISSLLPFVPILKGGGEAKVVKQALYQLRTEENLQNLEPLLSFFASFVLEVPIIQQIMRWDMTVLRESPWYQAILKEGLEKGEKQGLQQGLQQGEQAIVLRQLNRRLGNLDFPIREKINSLTTTQLEDLAEALLDFSGLEDLQNWLKNH